MKHLLNIRDNDGRSVVSARELYEFLEVKTDFTNWCKRMFEYGFVENLDYALAKIGEPTVHNKTDYALSIECAKEISMLQRTEKGKQAREYFIDCEKRLLTPNDDEIILRAVTTLQNRVDAYKSQLSEAKQIIQIQAPKVRYVDEVLDAPNLITTTVIAKDLGMSATTLNKILYHRGVIYKMAETWVLYSKYQDRGYTKTKTHTYLDNTGVKKTSIQTYWTEKGREFINKILNNALKLA